METFSIRHILARSALAGLAMAVVASAAPIRVGIFTGVGSGRFWHTSSHTAANAIASLLADPGASNLGPDLVIHPQGVLTARFGLVTGTGTPSLGQKLAFLEALDTTDVAIFIHNTEIGSIFSDSIFRGKLASFSRTRGILSLHETTDSYGTWPEWDSLQGARFQNFPTSPSERLGTLHLDTAALGDPAKAVLHRGLPDTVRFRDEWFSFVTNGDVIRAKSGLKVLLNIDENSYAQGNPPSINARVMGDHPMAWYKTLPEGGRFFYTAAGHRAQTYLGTDTSGTTPEAAGFLRRHIYNAVLWTAGYNKDGTLVRASTPPGRFAGLSRISVSGSALTISLLREGGHAIEITDLDGRRVAFRTGTGRAGHTFAGLRPGMVYAVKVTAGKERAARLVAIP